MEKNTFLSKEADRRVHNGEYVVKEGTSLVFGAMPDGRIFNYNISTDSMQIGKPVYSLLNSERARSRIDELLGK